MTPARRASRAATHSGSVAAKPVPKRAAASTRADEVLNAPASCGCGCGASVASDKADEGRKAIAVDPDIKARNLVRLRRIEGQVRGLQRMVEEDRYCADILTQIASVHEALRSVGRALMRNHLTHCATSAIRSTPEAAEQMYDELVNLIYTSAR